MFNLQRYFLATSAVVVVVTTVLVIWLYRQSAVDEVVASAQKSGTTLAQSFVNQVWPAFAEYVNTVEVQDGPNIGAYHETAALQEVLEGLSRGLPVVGIRILSANRLTVFSTDSTQIGAVVPDKTGPLAAAFRGAVSSKLLRRTAAGSADEDSGKRDVVETLLPIKGRAHKVEGVFVLQTDVTDMMARVQRTTSQIAVVVLLAFGTLYAALFLIVRRADGIVGQQYGDLLKGREQLEARNKQLRFEIDERTKAEKAMFEAHQAAELANRAKSEFLANMSHELRTPLNAVIGFSDTILNETFGPIGNSKYVDYLHDISGAGQHLLALISDILDISKIEAGEDELKEESLDIAAAVESSLALLRDTAGNAGVALNAEVRAPTYRLLADARKLRQIVLNIVSNAIKFTPEGGRVDVEAWPDSASGLVLQVTDSGIGMAPDDIPKALSLFGQVDAGMDRKFEGAGLGLPLAKRLAELHGATFDIESELGAGTRVTIRFGPERLVAPGDERDGADAGGEAMPEQATAAPR
jgi:signal transduction histidine kinase